MAPKPNTSQLKAKSESTLYSERNPPGSPSRGQHSPYFPAKSQSNLERPQPDGQKGGVYERTSQRYVVCLLSDWGGGGAGVNDFRLKFACKVSKQTSRLHLKLIIYIRVITFKCIR